MAVPIQTCSIGGTAFDFVNFAVVVYKNCLGRAWFFENFPEIGWARAGVDGPAGFGDRWHATLEKICIETVEPGSMTLELLLLIGPKEPWLNMRAFLEKLDEKLRKAMT